MATARRLYMHSVPPTRLYDSVASNSGQASGRNFCSPTLTWETYGIVSNGVSDQINTAYNSAEGNNTVSVGCRVNDSEQISRFSTSVCVHKGCHVRPHRKFLELCTSFSITLRRCKWNLVSRISNAKYSWSNDNVPSPSCQMNAGSC